MAPPNSTNKPRIVPVVVTLSLSAGILIALWIAGSRQLTNTESVLLGILLSAASMLASWLATHLYSQVSLRDTIKEATDANTENTRNLGVRAAEKVLNLSTELQRLMDALTTALEDADEAEGNKAPLLLLRERVLSAVHNIETLKSMNDTFLSDWRGVIGDEIERQHVLEKQIESLTEELENQIRERNVLRSQVVSSDDLAAVQSRIEETEQRLTQKIGALPFKVSPKPSKSGKQDVVVNCASCDAEMKIRLRRRKGTKKLHKCAVCESYSQISVVGDGEFDVTPIPMYDFEGSCPLCRADVFAQIPDFVSAMTSIKCNSCDVQLVLSKASTGANLRIPKATQKQMPQKLVEAVVSRLPPQRPWPTHIHKSIATELGISNGQVSRIIGQLIDKGQFPLEPSASDVETQAPLPVSDKET